MQVIHPVSGKDIELRNLHRMVVIQPGEEVICIITRHPVGIIGEYIGALFAIIAASSIVLFALEGRGTTTPQPIFYIGLLVLAVLLIGVLGAATQVYWKNHWVITSDSLTQVSQRSLFGAQVSALSFENLEDVTVEKRGLWPHLFNYGTLKAETAGDHSKFQFTFCPDPVEYARKIIDAREKYVASKKG